VPALQNSNALRKDTQDMPTFDHVWKFIQWGGSVNTGYMDVRRGEIVLEFNGCVVPSVGR
jgi:hypothetical protein